MARNLPGGTVTFLFTDVEGSTRLLRELGAERYAEALGAHRVVVRDALAAYGGVEVDTQGDAFFCAFASARSAVACASEIREALAGGPVRVRMGLHTGEALVVDDHYVGLDVHRAARIGACGHGGQVVLSPTTVALLDPDELALTGLGEHRLKDLAAPVRLYQLGDERFPPLKALFRTNLPVPATPFLGREAELSELTARASEPGLRALTLTGPGGTGKTRLALQLAAEISSGYPDGVWWAPLAPLRDGSLVASAVAGVLDVEEDSGRPLAAAISNTLAPRRAVLLLDNCEHLVDAAAELAGAIVGACPDVLVLATSREALAIAGEQVFPVQALAREDAVELFRARAHAAGASLGTGDDGVVVELCERLDNLPLAVELAAARAALLPPRSLLDRLSSGLDVLKGPRDAEERQRTLRATIAWSYGLLEEREQRLFRRLGVFLGGAPLPAIEDVCDADLDDLLSLAAKSLVRQAQGANEEPRYFMLETIRDFAVDELAAAGERSAFRERHLELFTRFADEAREGFEGPESGAWLTRFEDDLANLRAALAFAADTDRVSEAAILALALTTRHLLRGRYSEAEAVIGQVLALDLDPYTSAGLTDRLARALRVQGRPEEALAAFRDAERTLDTVQSKDATWWRIWIDLRIDEAHLFYFENAREELAALVAELEPLVAERGTPAQRLDLLHLRAQYAYRIERYAPSESTEVLVREIYRRAQEQGDVSADFTLGFCLLWRGELDAAESCFARGTNAARARGVAILETRCRVYGVVARRRRNDVAGAREWLGELEGQDELHGYRGLTAANAAWLAYRDGDLERALARGEEALAEWQTQGLRGSRVFEWTARFPLLGVALARGETEVAREHARSMLDQAQQPLPPELEDALRQAVDGGADELARALELARSLGYA